MIDTLQLGEIEGIHHGTYREGMWWWLDRGYTPAGVEAWNCVRALDYLETRHEVDRKRIGVTGRSGGGAYSWWIAAIDERIKSAVPVAGITDLQNHVVDGMLEGHCDCMFMVNTYRWDFAPWRALVAPRPLLIAQHRQRLASSRSTASMRIRHEAPPHLSPARRGEKLGLQSAKAAQGHARAAIGGVSLVQSLAPRSGRADLRWSPRSSSRRPS